MWVSNIHLSMHPVHPDGALGNSRLVSKPCQSQKTRWQWAISCLWSWYLIQMLLCVESQWVLIKLRVRALTSGTPCMDLVRKTTVILTDCQLESGTTCFQTTFTEIIPKKMHLLLWNPPIFYGSWFKGPTRYVKTRALGEHMYQQKTQNHELGLFWTGENDMVVFQCTDPCMSSYVTETIVGNMEEINCVIKQGQGIVLPLCFQDILILLFIYILSHLVIFFPGLVGDIHLIWIYWSQQPSGLDNDSLRAVAESCFQGQCTDVWGYPAAEGKRVHPSFLLSLLIPVICYFAESIFICLKWHKWHKLPSSRCVSRCILLPKCNYREAASSQKPNESAVIIYWLIPHYSRAFFATKVLIRNITGVWKRTSVSKEFRKAETWMLIYFLVKLG